MVAIVGHNYKRVFYDECEAIEEMHKLTKKNTIFVATNLQFDICGLVRETKHHKEMFPMIRGGRFISCKLRVRIKNKKKILKFWDTMSYFPVGVKTLGEQIAGVPKLDSPSYMGKRKPKTKIETEYFEKYCLRDAEISYLTMVKTQENLNDSGGEMKMTSASTSMDLWRRKYQDREIIIPPTHITDKLFKAYYGGRTECFIRGQGGKCTGFDINSLYPFCMLNKFPVPDSWKHTINPKKSMIKKYEGVSHVKIKAPYSHKPYLPFRHKTGKLLFPYGTWNGWYSHFELREATEKYGYEIEDIYETVYFTKVWYPFKKYVLDGYSARKIYKKEKNTAKEQLEKLKLNSLYGRFALRTQGNRQIFHVDSLTGEQIDKLQKQGYTEKITGEFGEWRYYDLDNVSEHPLTVLPILSLYVTAYARDTLYRYIRHDSNVRYVDTDSVFTTGEMKTSLELGDMKKEYEALQSVFVRPKFYYVVKPDGKIKVRVKGTRIATKKQFEKVINEGKEISKRKFAGFQMCNRKFKGNFFKWNQMITVKKKLNIEDTKRDWRGQDFDIHGTQTSEPLEIFNGEIVNRVYQNMIEIENVIRKANFESVV